MEQLPRRSAAPAVRAAPASRTEFQATHSSLSDRVESFLTQVVVLGLVALTLVQLLHTNPRASRMLSLVERLEGVPVGEIEAWSQPVALTIVTTSTRSAPGAKLLVDGQVVGTFATGKLTVNVNPGQSLSVEAEGLPGLTLQVSGPVAMTSPPPGVPIIIQGGTQPLGVVRTGP